MTGIGQDAAGVLPPGLVKDGVPEATGDWSVAFVAPSGWSIVLSQDCDIVRADDDEPTVEIAPVLLVPVEEHAKYVGSRYTGRYLALSEGAIPGLDNAQRGLVDLAWRSSILKVSFTQGPVEFNRPLTEPQRRELGDWLAARSGRTAFPDDLVTGVLDPFDALRTARTKSASKKPVGSRTDVERIVTSPSAWYVARREHRIVLTGVVSDESFTRAGWSEEDIAAAQPFDADGANKEPAGPVVVALQKLNTELLSRLAKAPPTGYEVAVSILDLRAVSAADFMLLRRLER
ncbi:MAG TPA: hypothetical protein VMU76_11105 [Acidimicrobiales bacterium]|nr:hypothetical protein [Acidimicrobiales bacterium]